MSSFQVTTKTSDNFLIEAKTSDLIAVPQPSAGHLTLFDISSNNLTAGKLTTLTALFGLENSILYYGNADD